ncbi:hypothetical protein [Candidatus Amarolinea dominans]|uniref:hypothetical protein n=1 Tax=Candidatus Amarolinea dominans TaxID=3140696 RepID=UPI0031CC5793
MRVGTLYATAMRSLQKARIIHGGDHTGLERHNPRGYGFPFARQDTGHGRFLHGGRWLRTSSTSRGHLVATGSIRSFLRSTMKT